MIKIRKPFSMVQRVPVKDPQPGIINIVAETPSINLPDSPSNVDLAVKVKISNTHNIKRAMITKSLNQKSGLVRDNLITQVHKSKSKRRLR